MALATASVRRPPDRFPLRPLPTCARRPPRPHEPRRDHRLVTVEQAVQLSFGEEVDIEAGLRAIAVTDGEAAISRAFDEIVFVLEVGPTALTRAQKRPPAISRACAARM